MECFRHYANELNTTFGQHKVKDFTLDIKRVSNVMILSSLLPEDALIVMG